MNAMLRTFIVSAACALAAGCAGIGGQARTEKGPGVLKPEAMTPQRARDAVTIGKSTKAEVRAALGPAITIPFDSGYEVWVYRWLGSGRTTRGDTELVVLFDKDGVVKKTRVRPGYTGD